MKKVKLKIDGTINPMHLAGDLNFLKRKYVSALRCYMKAIELSPPPTELMFDNAFSLLMDEQVIVKESEKKEMRLALVAAARKCNPSSIHYQQEGLFTYFCYGMKEEFQMVMADYISTCGRENIMLEKRTCAMCFSFWLGEWNSICKLFDFRVNASKTDNNDMDTFLEYCGELMENEGLLRRIVAQWKMKCRFFEGVKDIPDLLSFLDDGTMHALIKAVNLSVMCPSYLLKVLLKIMTAAYDDDFETLQKTVTYYDEATERSQEKESYEKLIDQVIYFLYWERYDELESAVIKRHDLELEARRKKYVEALDSMYEGRRHDVSEVIEYLKFREEFASLGFAQLLKDESQSLYEWAGKFQKLPVEKIVMIQPNKRHEHEMDCLFALLVGKKLYERALEIAPKLGKFSSLLGRKDDVSRRNELEKERRTMAIKEKENALSSLADLRHYISKYPEKESAMISEFFGHERRYTNVNDLTEIFEYLIFRASQMLVDVSMKDKERAFEKSQDRFFSLIEADRKEINDAFGKKYFTLGSKIVKMFSQCKKIAQCEENFFSSGGKTFHGSDFEEQLARKLVEVSWREKVSDNFRALFLELVCLTVRDMLLERKDGQKKSDFQTGRRKRKYEGREWDEKDKPVIDAVEVSPVVYTLEISKGKDFSAFEIIEPTCEAFAVYFEPFGFSISGEKILEKIAGYLLATPSDRMRLQRKVNGLIGKTRGLWRLRCDPLRILFKLEGDHFYFYVEDRKDIY